MPPRGPLTELSFSLSSCRFLWEATPSCHCRQAEAWQWPLQCHSLQMTALLFFLSSAWRIGRYTGRLHSGISTAPPEQGCTDMDPLPAQLGLNGGRRPGCTSCWGGGAGLHADCSGTWSGTKTYTRETWTPVICNGFLKNTPVYNTPWVFIFRNYFLQIVFV